MSIKPLVFASFLIAAIPSHAEQIYKCISPAGVVTFSNNPYCEQAQAHTKRKYEALQSVQPTELTEVPPGKLIEIYFESMDLPDLLEDIGRFARVPIEPVALEGNEIKVKIGTYGWHDFFQKLAKDNNLDYRLAYNHLYVYEVGSMGETIVHNPDLLRWYQSDATWNAVLRNDDLLLGMAAYQNTDLKERLNSLIWRVRQDLGEESAVNAAQPLTVKEGYTSGVSSGVAAQESTDAIIRRSNAEKARRITSRRQSN